MYELEIRAMTRQARFNGSGSTFGMKAVGARQGGASWRESNGPVEWRSLVGPCKLAGKPL